MTTVKTWLASAALVGGAGSGAIAALATAGGAAQPAAAALPAPASTDTSRLQVQIAALLQEDRSLKQAVRQARHRLAGQVNAGERSLALLHRRIVAAQNELARLQATQAPARPLTTMSTPTPASTPQAHATTGASGAGGASGDDAGEHEGGGDD